MICSHNTLANYYQLTFQLMQHHKYSLTEVENLMPFERDIMLYGGEDGEILTAAEILYDNGFDSFCFTDSFEALLSSAGASYLSVTDAAQKQIKDQLQNSDSLTGVQIIVEPISRLKTKYRIELVDQQQQGAEC